MSNKYRYSFFFVWRLFFHFYFFFVLGEMNVYGIISLDVSGVVQFAINSQSKK